MTGRGNDMEREKRSDTTLLERLEDEAFLAAVEDGHLPEDASPEERAAIEELQGLLELYRASDLEEPPESADRAILAAARKEAGHHTAPEEPEPASWWSRILTPGWSLAAAAAVLLVVAGGILLRHGRPRRPRRGTSAPTERVEAKQKRVAPGIRKSPQAPPGPLASLGDQARRDAPGSPFSEKGTAGEQARAGTGGAQPAARGFGAGGVDQGRIAARPRLVRKGERLLASAETARRSPRLKRLRAAVRRRALKPSRGPAGVARSLEREAPRDMDTLGGGVPKPRAAVAARPPAAPSASAPTAGREESGTPMGQWRLARRLVRQGKLRRALAIYRRLAPRFRQNPRFLWEWANLEQRTGHGRIWRQLYAELKRKHPEFLRRTRSRRARRARARGTPRH